MKKKLIIGLILAIIIIASLTATTIALAAGSFTKEATASVVVLQPTPNIEVYSDPGCTTPVTGTVSFGSLYPGQASAVTTLYVKNIGQINFTSVDSQLSMGTSLGTYTFSADLFPLTVGNVQQVDIQVTISATAAPGNYPAIPLKFVGSYS